LETRIMKRLIATAALAAGTMLAATSFANAQCSDTGFQILGNGSIVPCAGSPAATNGRPWYQQRPHQGQQYYRNQRHRHQHYDDDYYDDGPTFFFSFGQPHYYRR
jgi:hypothetical protein